MRNTSLLWWLALLSAPNAALGDDASSNFLVKLFVSVCIPNVGQPEKVRDWAADHGLQEITTPAALNVFVGPGPKGIAWAVPSAVGSFALSVRGTTEACAVWARVAAPNDVENMFRPIVEGAARAGVDVSVIKDAHDRSPSGIVHTLIYSVSGTEKFRGGFLYTMQTAERPGGPFQASLQAARFSTP
jgi:hypothetical protein